MSFNRTSIFSFYYLACCLIQYKSLQFSGPVLWDSRGIFEVKVTAVLFSLVVCVTRAFTTVEDGQDGPHQESIKALNRPVT